MCPHHHKTHPKAKPHSPAPHHKASAFTIGETPLGSGTLGEPTKEEQLYDRGLLQGFYTIEVSPDACNWCLRHEDQVYSFEEDDPLPPFHDNCQCEVSVQMVDLVDFDWTQFRDIFDTRNGTIGELATPEIITRAINDILRARGLEQELTWEQILEFGIYTPGEAMAEPISADTPIEDLVGSQTLIDESTIINGDEEMERLRTEAREDGEDIADDDRLIRLVRLGQLARPHGKYDAKNDPDSPFGPEEDDTRRVWGAIIDGKLQRYDYPGNYMFGYLCYHAGYTLWETISAAAAFADIVSGSSDDTYDTQAILDGYRAAQSGH